ncbi:MAG TPA: hypothetical protein VHY91_04985 [Pirellulales bacterium]|nr:hypothetical protein [Pirellulales bacterium]
MPAKADLGRQRHNPVTTKEKLKPASDSVDITAADCYLPESHSRDMLAGVSASHRGTPRTRDSRLSAGCSFFSQLGDGTLNLEILKSGTTKWTGPLGIALVCAAVATWGCSKSERLAADRHDHDHHGHDHHASATVDDIEANLAKLSASDRKLAEAQGFCVIRTDEALGSVGVPYKLTIHDRTVFLCCEHCKDAALKNPQTTLATLDDLLQHRTASSPKHMR